MNAITARMAKLPEPRPDYRHFLAMLRREPVERVPLIELAVHPRVVDELLGLAPDPSDAARGDRGQLARRSVRLHHQLGYDVVKVSAPIPFDMAHGAGADDRTWANLSAGPIASVADVVRYRWPTVATVDFTPLDAAEAVLPKGMKLIGFAGGVLEFALDLVGMERFMIATRRDPELVEQVIAHVGQIIYDVFSAYCRRESVCALWLGDDLGYKSGPLLAPAFLTAHILPWYRRYAELAHQHNRPLLLHSCGDVASVMPALVETVGIDAKHSFEDGIQPVETFYDQWHERIAVLGGIDVHLLATASEAEIAGRTRQVLDHTAECGGYACGSGNSITDYIPATSYLAMIEAVHAFNAQRKR
jgi:uroporphyrinogen decarboxylase